jgi:ribose transport system substrate-binding protein
MGVQVKVRVVEGLTEFKGFIEGLKGRRPTRVNERRLAWGSGRQDIPPQRTSSPPRPTSSPSGRSPAAPSEQRSPSRLKEDSVKVIGYGFTQENIAAIRDGSMARWGSINSAEATTSP